MSARKPPPRIAPKQRGPALPGDAGSQEPIAEMAEGEGIDFEEELPPESEKELDEEITEELVEEIMEPVVTTSDPVPEVIPRAVQQRAVESIEPGWKLHSNVYRSTPERKAIMVMAVVDEMDTLVGMVLASDAFYFTPQYLEKDFPRGDQHRECRFVAPGILSAFQRLTLARGIVKAGEDSPATINAESILRTFGYTVRAVRSASA